MLGGPGACPPPLKMFDKYGVIWCILSVPKLVITNLKINIVLDNKSTTGIFVPYVSPRSIQMRILAKQQIHSHFSRGSEGNSPQKPKKYKLEDLKVLRRSPDLLNNVKIGQG